MKKESVKTKKTEVKEIKITAKKLPWMKIAVVLVLVLIGAAYYQFGNVAYVDGKPISRIEYIQMMEKQAGESILDQMITETLILNEAEKKGEEISQEVIDAEIKSIEDQLTSQGNTLDEVLANEKMTKEDLVKQIRLQKLVEKLAGGEAEVTEEQIEAFLEENKDFLPEDATQEELNQLAKDQIGSQSKNEAINNWLEKIRAEATIIYK